MEPVGAFFDEEFEFLKMFTNVNDDFLLSNPADNNFISPQAFLHEEATNNSNTIMAHNLYLQSFDSHNIESFVSQESSNSSGSEIQGYFKNGSLEGNNVDTFLTLPNNDSLMHLLAMDDTQNVGDNNTNNAHQLKRKLHDNAANQNSYHHSSSTQFEAPKKKPRAPRNKNNKSTNKGQTKKKKKIVEDNNIREDKESSENGGKQIQGPTCSLSEDDSNALEEANGEVTTSECKDYSSLPNNNNSKGKKRAARGNATDPQSLYARKRRERINERLRVLQNLVPNGTKVDISTMLEEAVQYVKFLQLQIQLLSSDDMWMFAPLVFNGMDVGVYQRMFPHL